MEKLNEYSPCDYTNRVRDNQPKRLTREYFLTLLEDIGVRMNTEKIREHKPDAERYKRELPGITWQSRFDGQLRTDRNAKSTGLYCLDVDCQHEETFKQLLQTEGADAAWRWGTQEAHARAERWTKMAMEEATGQHYYGLDIIAIQISPQGAGVHVVAACNEVFGSIEENQAHLAKLLGTPYDQVCKDAARMWFVTPKEDWVYLDMESLFQIEE